MGSDGEGGEESVGNARRTSIDDNVYCVRYGRRCEEGAVKAGEGSKRVKEYERGGGKHTP